MLIILWLKEDVIQLMIQSYRSKTELPVPLIGFGPTTFQLVIRMLNTTEQRLTTISVEIR